MNSRERQLLLRVYHCVREVAALGPPNPADLQEKLRAHGKQKKASKEVAAAISSIGYSDFDFAAEHLAVAEGILDIDAEGRRL